MTQKDVVTILAIIGALVVLGFVLRVTFALIGPLLILALARSRRFNDDMRRIMYFLSALLIQVGIFSMRWNVVIGGQLFSKSYRGLMAYKMELTGIESLWTALVLLALPFMILTVLNYLLPTRWLEKRALAAH